MKNVALVTAYFPPSGLTGAHRARIWSTYLPEFGWNPTIVTVDWDYYEEALDWGLMGLLDPELKVVRAKAFRTKPIRIIGNIAIRSLYWTYKALDEMWAKNQLDFVHLIVPDHYSAVLGPLLYRKHHLPYGIDYMDPWVHARPSEKRFLSKAWISCCLSYYLEPWAVRNAKLITGVAPQYYEGVLRRNPSVKNTARAVAMPQVNPETDFVAASRNKPEHQLFAPDDGNLHFVYAGTLTPKMLLILRKLLEAVKSVPLGNSSGDRFRFTFIGTGRDPKDPTSNTVMPIAAELGLQDRVLEFPGRIGYLETLWHLQAATVVLVIGSTDRHYSPSKIFQALQSKRPVLAILHADSSANQMIRKYSRVELVTFTEDRATLDKSLEDALGNLINGAERLTDQSENEEALWTARKSTRILADAFDRAIAPS